MKLDLPDEVLVHCATQASLLDDGMMNTREEFRAFFGLIMERLSDLAHEWASQDPPIQAHI